MIGYLKLKEEEVDKIYMQTGGSTKYRGSKSDAYKQTHPLEIIYDGKYRMFLGSKENHIPKEFTELSLRESALIVLFSLHPPYIIIAENKEKYILEIIKTNRDKFLLLNLLLPILNLESHYSYMYSDELVFSASFYTNNFRDALTHASSYTSTIPSVALNLDKNLKIKSYGIHNSRSTGKQLKEHRQENNTSKENKIDCMDLFNVGIEGKYEKTSVTITGLDVIFSVPKEVKLVEFKGNTLYVSVDEIEDKNVTNLNNFISSLCDTFTYDVEVINVLPKM